MKDKISIILLYIFTIVLIIFGIILVIKKYVAYSLITYMVAISVGTIVSKYSINNKNPNTKYDSTLKNILNTYDSVLVDTKKVPSLEDKNIILVKKIDDLIDAQSELRKPIYYFKQTDSCSFTIFDDEQAIIYILKRNEKVLAPIEIEIKNNLLKKKNKNDIDEEILDQISKTTVVKLPNNMSYKISPVKKDKIERKDDDIEVL